MGLKCKICGWKGTKDDPVKDQQARGCYPKYPVCVYLTNCDRRKVESVKAANMKNKEVKFEKESKMESAIH
jgi:hypothetical protein